MSSCNYFYFSAQLAPCDYFNLLLPFRTLHWPIAHKPEYNSESMKFTCLFEKLQHFAFLMRPQMKFVQQPPWINCLILFDCSVLPSTSTKSSSAAFCVNADFIQNKQRNYNHFDFFHLVSVFYFSKFLLFSCRSVRTTRMHNFLFLCCCWCVESNAN